MHCSFRKANESTGPSDRHQGGGETGKTGRGEAARSGVPETPPSGASRHHQASAKADKLWCLEQEVEIGREEISVWGFLP